ncbi:MAG: Uncharacterised protein [Synechococcus sp. MIT S9220]|nr:MAG: Uncharacterised protein [Synechococcus sp. MIT S9220]
MAKAKTFDFGPALKASIKAAGVPRGWNVSSHRGFVHLRVRKSVDGKMTCWSKNLPGLQWEVGCIGPVTEIVSNLHKTVSGEEPKSLDQAWAELYPEEEEPEPGVPTAIGGINWSAICAAYYQDRQEHGKKISDKTLKLEQTYCGQALKLLQAKNPPQTPYKLIGAAITAGGWTDKPRARQQCVGAVTRMLTYGLAHEGLSGDWILPQHQKLTLAGNGKADEKKEIAILSDLQIIELLDSVPTEAWRNVLLVMAVYGLRPEELMHLTPKVNPTTGKLQLWCSYRKAAGGRSKKTMTEPRWLQAVPISGPDGDVPAHDLAAAIEANLLPFPPLKERGAAVAQYLGRQKLWRQWAEEFETRGQWLRSYSFRNSFSVRAHLRGLPGASVAMAMGHSELTHSTHYVTATTETTSEVFERILGES